LRSFKWCLWGVSNCHLSITFFQNTHVAVANAPPLSN
jgi:hypothetical protein